MDAFLLSNEELTNRLREVGERRYHDKHPYHIRMHDGKLSPEQLRAWVANRFYYQKNIPVKDALILSKLPSRDDRRKWIQRIIDHDGREGSEGGIEAWVRLGEACGIPRDEMLGEKHVLPAVRFAVDAYVNFCRLQPWPIAVASSLTELFAPTLVSKRIGVFLELYPWIKPEGLEYFRARLHQAPRDADHGLELVLRECKSRDDQEQAIAALSFKCDVLWALLDALSHAYPNKEVAT
ncbi:pyrroloquinoline-quinone synthase PqqC [Cohnella lubricantis]|uniref:Pyrroloquinoline-quinone synthase n=1 Tax=Cohnella lubricantis TaxID=2163172 RepID=A0A841T9D6_9BACL|nr:pyrroloquinoline-quinone synthase PqqC [Cohnella lubricantis]MBB6676038.1 pyrroloquinoline-quinone synthase PqqC [Cohnella lubricantis]MBP2117993.1 pyrroloquinoline-quinone synthase [Cohnella lubricantis]